MVIKWQINDFCSTNETFTGRRGRRPLQNICCLSEALDEESLWQIRYIVNSYSTEMRETLRLRLRVTEAR